MSTVQVIGIIAGVCTSISLLPQLIKTIKEKKDGDILVWNWPFSFP
jgi:MtN3 and saliva related transmembrane protein